MKIKTIFIMLLFPFVLCSCSNNSNEKTSEPESVAEKINIEDSSDTETITDEIDTVDPTDTELLSIVFMGETITAPGHYPDVPDLYSPILDDLYLYGELALRYSTLNYEGLATTKIMRECEALQKEISQREHLPYEGLHITSGYTLYDLDDDGNCELLILDNSPYYNHMPVIKSIYAIRNEQLVYIYNGSFEFNYAILTADNTFYQCIDWRSGGYVDLSAFRLDAGMSEFTIVSEAHSTLSFSEGDIPVPYWTKIENGNETTISEDEFYELLDQYKNQKEPIELNFIPLHPDAVDPWLTPRPTTEPPIISVEYPATYPDAPKAYKPILDALFLLEDNRRQEGYTIEEYLGPVGFIEWPYPIDSMLGYALVDINNDGILELLLGTSDGLNASAPNSIFTLKDGQPVLVDIFWSRSRGVISADGIIYNVGSGGAAYTYLSSYRLDKYADSLTQLTDMRSDYSASEEKSYFYQVIEDRNHYISEQEFWDFYETYDNPPEKMELTFIPMADLQFQ